MSRFLLQRFSIKPVYSRPNELNQFCGDNFDLNQQVKKTNKCKSRQFLVSN